ncbi:MAG: peptidoglycan-binding protein, partial [Sporichthyaceae bacterium]|nr:peptidoglycan-binding protein [Sporichthyaceae bacterium]
LVETDSVDGTLGYGDAVALAGHAAGTITWLPAPGRQLTRGHTLYEVDERRVTLMYGAVPMYRTLSVGAEGAGVKQLEQNLRALGYTGFTVDQDYTSATASAVEEWQADRGLPETGSVDPSQVVFADGAVRVAGHQVTVGGTVQPGQAVLDLTSTRQIITVDLDVADRTLAKKGAAVTVELPDGTTLRGHIDSVGKVAESSSDSSAEQPDATSDGSATITVIVTLDKGESAGPFDEAPVLVHLESERHENVLTVPVSALLALSEDQYAVQVVAGATSRTVPVETGAYADGRVEIDGVGIAEGAQVEVPAS